MTGLAFRHGLLGLLLTVGVPAVALAQSVAVTGTVELDPDGRGSSGIDPVDAVVWLTPLGPTAGGVGPTPAMFEIIQEEKRFLPRVLPVPTGSSVDFPNLDPFFHNVFSLFDGKRFDLGLYEAGTSRSTRFGRPGISYVFCNIHPEMVAIVLTVDTDLFALTDAGGEFRLDGVPSGDYRLRVWHEQMAVGPADADRVVSVGATALALSPVRMVARTSGLDDHLNKFGQEYESPEPSTVPYLLPR